MGQTALKAYAISIGGVPAFGEIWGKNAGQTACKPGSVPAREGDGWPFLWDVRYRTPRATDPGDDAETPLPVARRAAPIWSCSRWGLPCRFRCRSRGGLLPHRFTLAWLENQPGGLFSVALSLGSPPPAVNRHRVSVEPGLSSPLLAKVEQPSSHLTRVEYSAAMSGITIRPALLDEADALSALCLRSKAHWGYDAAFMALSQDALTISPALIKTG